MSEPHYPGLFTAEFNRDPYPIFARMRREAPVYHHRYPNGEKACFVTRYTDVEQILRDDSRFTKDLHKMMTPEQIRREPPVLRLVQANLVNQDPPNHTRLRALVGSAFTPRRVEALRGRIEELARSLLDEATLAGAMDFIETFAFDLPVIVIAELLGLPPSDRDRFRRWSDALATTSYIREQQQKFLGQMTEFTEYLGQQFTRRRRSPEDDMLTALVQVEEDGDRFSEEELYRMVMLLLVAGHETTSSFLGNALLALLLHPESLERFRDDPGVRKTAVEELLRYDGPVGATTGRWALEDVELDAGVIGKGELVRLVVASANRDERRFERSDELVLERKDNPHLAFGKGIHYCIGAPLARLEGELALGMLLERFPKLRLAAAARELTWRPGFLIRGLDRLPIAWT